MAVPVSFVLRLLENPLRDGRVVGEVEDVDSGARWRIRDADELISLLTRGDGADRGSLGSEDSDG